MPNWVYSTMNVKGSPEQLELFKEKARQQHTQLGRYTTSKYDPEIGKHTSVAEELVGTIYEELSGESDLSFWNFISPAEEDLPYYFGLETKSEEVVPEGLSAEERLARALTFNGSDWYNWNITNWGTKWDANEVNLDGSPTSGELSYYFSTAWGIPMPVLGAMVSQHPELSFEIRSTEEQGWGAEMESEVVEEDGVLSSQLIVVKEWDIPDSHADWVATGNEEGCNCSWSDDPDDLYTDCPSAEREFLVVVSKTYRVRTNTAENAWELAESNNPDEQMELVEDETSILVKDPESNERLFPIAELI